VAEAFIFGLARARWVGTGSFILVRDTVCTAFLVRTTSPKRGPLPYFTEGVLTFKATAVPVARAEKIVVED
jgi:hypothetical protein